MRASSPYKLGPSFQNGGVHFSIYVTGNKKVELEIPELEKRVLLEETTPGFYETFIATEKKELEYFFLIDGKKIIDPWARGIKSSHSWGKEAPVLSKTFIPKDFDWQEVKAPGHKASDLIIYELHVRGFTSHPKSDVAHPGKFLGVIDRIPHLINLGVNAVELMPIHEFNELDNPRINPFTKERLYNYWGYDSISFFGLMNRYGIEDTESEFKTMVRELHRFGIEVIVDVVYNHISIDPHSPFPATSEAYFKPDCNDSGCGNTLDSNHPQVQAIVLASLKRLHKEFHVDGFRFDLATVLKPDLIQKITEDPDLKQAKLIAEPWDIFHYEGGHFYPNSRWYEWSDLFRDACRKFIRGDKGIKEAFYKALQGVSTINFITSHDGFSLRDLVVYNNKHNLPNGENNHDGSPYNFSWNSGKEGPSDDIEINRLRLRQLKNFFLALLVGKGVPMITMGDEYGHTKVGNNNTWCQDNVLSWFDWGELDANETFFKTVQNLVRLRKTLSKNSAFTEIKTPSEHVLVFLLDKRFLIAFNAQDAAYSLNLPSGMWKCLFHSSELPPKIEDQSLHMENFSSIVLSA